MSSRRRLAVYLATSLVTAGVISAIVVTTGGDGGQEVPQAASSQAAGSGSSSSVPGSSGEGGTRGNGPQPGPAPSGPLVPTFGSDYLQYGIDDYGPDDPTPLGCTMKRREVCKIRFRGSYRLVTYDNGFIKVGAYENGSDEPLYSTELPVKAGQADWHVTIPYRSSAEAKTVRFRAHLLGPDKQLIGEGQPTAKELPIKD